MKFQKGNKLAGSRKGRPNKVSADVRAAVAQITQRNIESVEAWLLKIKDPAKRVSLFLALCEYHIPKLARSDIQVSGDFNVNIVDPTRRGPS